MDQLKIEAVLLRNVKKQNFLSQKCRLRAVSRKQNAWRADPSLYPALSVIVQLRTVLEVSIVGQHLVQYLVFNSKVPLR